MTSQSIEVMRYHQEAHGPVPIVEFLLYEIALQLARQVELLTSMYEEINPPAPGDNWERQERLGTPAHQAHGLPR